MTANRKVVVAEGLWKDEFPDDNTYDDSLWARWETRIQEGHKAEESLMKSFISKPKESTPDCDDEYSGHAEGLPDKVTNNMYAGLVISLWSYMEGFLGALAGVCPRSQYPSKKKKTHLYKFWEIEKDFKKKYNIILKELPKYSVINAVRVLNNSFKHNEGFYAPDKDKLYDQINPELLTEWVCFTKRFADRNEIDYTKLPIRKLVISCNLFYQSTLSAVRKNLEGMEYEV